MLNTASTQTSPELAAALATLTVKHDKCNPLLFWLSLDPAAIERIYESEPHTFEGIGELGSVVHDYCMNLAMVARDLIEESAPGKWYEPYEEAGKCRIAHMFCQPVDGFDLKAFRAGIGIEFSDKDIASLFKLAFGGEAN